MRIPVLITIAVTGLAGCATNVGKPQAALAGSYACRLRNEAVRVVNPVAHLVTIMPDARVDSIQAAIDSMPMQLLTPMKGDTALFAGDRFAWRPQPNAGTLTDTRTVETFACVREASVDGVLTPGDANPPQPRPARLRRSYGRG